MEAAYLNRRWVGVGLGLQYKGWVMSARKT